MYRFKLKESVLVDFPSYLIALLPLFLITGPFLSDLSVVLVSIIFLIKVFYNKDYYIFKNIFFKIFLLFYFFLILNSLINYFDFNNLRVSITYLRFGIFFLAVGYYCKINKNIFKLIFIFLLICYLLLIVDGFYQYTFKENLVGFKTFDSGTRISSFFHEELIMGSYLSRLLPIFLGISFLLYGNKKGTFFLISGIFILVQILIFLSGERTSFFLSIISIIFIVLMLNKFKTFRLAILSIPVVLILIISVQDDSAKKRIWDYTIKQTGINSERFKFFSLHHESHFKSAYKMYSDNKLIGIGIRNYRNYCNDKKYLINNISCSTHPHNTYFQFLSELGLIGFSFLLFLFFIFSYFALCHLKEKFFKQKILFNNFQICLLAGILITIWPLAPSGNFFNNWLSIIYFYPIGMLLWSFQNNKY